MTNDQALVDRIISDYRQVPELDEKTKAILDYAVKLTVKPNSVRKADIDHLKAKGLTDREILDACQITSYFNFVNRMAEGLGVELEE